MGVQEGADDRNHNHKRRSLGRPLTAPDAPDFGFAPDRTRPARAEASLLGRDGGGATGRSQQRVVWAISQRERGARTYGLSRLAQWGGGFAMAPRC
jgi:hypothetical protein